MRLSYLVLVLALLFVATAQEAPQGRERLRELVQKARAGDTEAQAILASRRRKIARNRDTGTSPRRRVETSAVESVLGGGRGSARRPSFQPTTAPPTSAPTRNRLSLRNRFRGGGRRGGSRAEEVEVTTFKPAAIITTAAPTTTAAPIEITEEPVQRTAAPFEEVQTETVFEEPTVVPHHVDLTPSTFIPSLFQPAQFGENVITRQPEAAPQPIRSREPIRQPETRQPEPRRSETRRPESRQRVNILHEPHRALNRGLETGTRSELFTPVAPDPTEEQTSRRPPVQTIRRYSYFDDAGNYVFGYEAEDGSFKEEVRGKDCIVNGKYGYVDPTGIRREFTYVSGNKCDPNNPDALLPDGTPVPLNDQFLHQTNEQQLSENQLEKLAFNRRRKPTAQVERQRPRIPQPQLQVVEPQIREPVRTRPAPRPVQRTSRLRPEEPEPVREVRPLETRPVDLTPTRVIPNMFKPAQFGSDGRGVAPEEDRFPVPDFISQSRDQEQQQRVEQPRRQETPRPTPTTTLPPPPPPTPAPRRPSPQPPRQFSPQPQRPIDTFNFDQEFRSVFSHFGNSGAPRAPPAPAQQQIPSLFQPAQFSSAPRPATAPRPAPTPRPAPPPKPAAPIEDNTFVLTSQQQSVSAPQLVFDASSGTFKTVQVQTNTRQEAPRQAAPRPPPPSQSNHFSNGGRPLPLFEEPRAAQHSGLSPLPPIPTSAAEFDRFFAQLG